MRDSVFPGDTMVLRGRVERVAVDEAGCAWAELALALSVGEKTMTECTARVALPREPGDNPWRRREAHWKP
jgi:hypothetical protein